MKGLKNTSRRGFLKKAAGIAAGTIGFPYIISASALGKNGGVAASERMTIGSIAVGGRGGSLLSNFLNLKDAQVVAVCDVKKPSRDNGQKMVNDHYKTTGCASYFDFRELCARDDIDAAVIASNDHWHVPHALEAVRSGKDVYCEKPLGMSVEQGQVLRREVNRYNRVFQFGTQERSSRNSRFVCEIVRSGRIGKIKKIIVASRYSITAENYPPMPVPDWIDYDLWLGPAPWAPYTANRVNNSHWFHISDYALGFIAGCGIHTIDIATWGNGTDLTGPLEVEGTGEFPTDGLCDCATGWDVNLYWANGIVMNFTDGERNPLGVKFEGEDGWAFVKEEHLGGKPAASDDRLLEKPLEPDEVHLPASNHHQQNFLDCVKSRARTVAPVESAVRSDTLCQLSDIAMRLGRKLRWDPDKEQFVNDAQASRMLSRPMRSPWRL
jgi:predicted dehydrogenase